MDGAKLSRRELLVRAGELGLGLWAARLLPAYAWAAGAAAQARPARPGHTVIELAIDELPVHFGGKRGTAVAINGTVPAPLVRLREGGHATIRVTNRLREDTSIHWHGILLPPEMDGVPGVSFAGIRPGETFEYRFPVKQYGTYWYHSHSGGQEQLGMYGPIVIDPAEPEPFRYDRDYTVVLSDWSFMHPMELLAKLKARGDYFNFQQRTLGDFFEDVAQNGLGPTLEDRLMWTGMRMDPTDLLDVTGAVYTYLMNGMPSALNWTGLFRPGERVRLRFIDAGAQTLFDVRIPGLRLTVVQVDGQHVKPVTVDEFRIAPGETYDVIVEPRDDRAYTVFAETLDRSGYAMGTLAPRPGMRGPMPERRKRALRSMADMGMRHGDGDHGGHGGHGGGAVAHGPDHHGPGNQMVAAWSQPRLHEPGIGLGEDGRRVLVYKDLQSIKAWEDQRPPAREIELHLTGNMERFMWSIDGKKFSEAPAPILFRHGERLRLTMVNDTMMEHPMHLHGMWMYVENGAGPVMPRKHTIIVKPAERLSVLITADAPVGPWAFHCHMLLHMEMGMFRVMRVVPGEGEVRS